MFEKFDPREGRLVSLLDESGRLARPPAGMPLLEDGEALAAYQRWCSPARSTSGR